MRLETDRILALSVKMQRMNLEDQKRLKNIENNILNLVVVMDKILVNLTKDKHPRYLITEDGKIYQEVGETSLNKGQQFRKVNAGISRKED